jgi:CBS-domain-containing membrane protein
VSPREVSEPLIRDAPLLRSHETVVNATRALVDSELPALPVIDGRERLAGVFGEREFLGAVFPGYVKELKHAGFVRRSLDETLEKRDECRTETVDRHMYTEHVHVDRDFSDLAVAEIFMHHRVLIVPVTDDGRVIGVITRADFFRSVAKRFLERGEGA